MSGEGALIPFWDVLEAIQKGLWERFQIDPGKDVAERATIFGSVVKGIEAAGSRGLIEIWGLKAGAEDQAAIPKTAWRTYGIDPLGHRGVGLDDAEACTTFKAAPEWQHAPASATIWRSLSLFEGDVPKLIEFCAEWHRKVTCDGDAKPVAPQGRGRPQKYKAEIVAEHARRVKAGKALVSVAAEARHLHKWISAQGRSRPPAADTIESHIRSAHAAYAKRQKKEK